MRRFEEQYRLNEGDDVLNRENAIHQDVDMRLDAVEQLGQAFAAGNRVDVDLLLKAIEETIASRALLFDHLIASGPDSIAPGVIATDAANRFTSDLEVGGLRDDAADGDVATLAAAVDHTDVREAVLRDVIGLATALAPAAVIDAGEVPNSGLMTSDLTRRQIAASITADTAGTIGGALNAYLTKDGDASEAKAIALGAAVSRAVGDRANDFVMLADDWSASRNFTQNVVLARKRLKEKGGGHLRYQRGGTDCGTSTHVETDSQIIHVGEGSTCLYSSASDSPLFTFGTADATMSRSGLVNIQVASSVARTAPLVRLVNAYEPIIEAVEAIAAAACPVAFDVDGGTNCYNNRLKGLRTFGPFANAVRVGFGALVQGFYLTDGCEFGSTTDSAILLLDVSGYEISECEALACLRGLEARPGVGQVVLAGQIGAGVLFDTCARQGVLLADQGGYIEYLTSSGLWCCSNGNDNGGSTKYNQFEAIASAFGHINNLAVLAAILGNGATHAVNLINVDGAEFGTCMANGNGAATFGVAYFVGNGCKNIKISTGAARGTFSPRSPFAAFQKYAALVDVQTENISILGRVDATGNLLGGVSSFSQGTNNKIVSGDGFYG